MTSACGSCSCFTDHLRHHSAVLSNAYLFILYIFFPVVRVFWLGLLPLCMDTLSSFHISVLFLAYAESRVLVSIFCFSLHRNWDFPCRVWDSCCISPTEVHLPVCRRILSHSYSCGCVCGCYCAALVPVVAAPVKSLSGEPCLPPTHTQTHTRIHSHTHAVDTVGQKLRPPHLFPHPHLQVSTSIWICFSAKLFLLQPFLMWKEPILFLL